MKKSLMMVFFLVLAIIQSTAYAAYDTLGANVKDGKTTFSIWAPELSSDVRVYYHDGSPVFPAYTELKLNKVKGFRDINGRLYTDVYSGTVNKDLSFCEYYFTVNGVQVADPYARMSSGENKTKLKEFNPAFRENVLQKNVVINLDKKYNFVPVPTQKELTHAIIYEMSVVDFTSNENSGIPKGLRGTYSGVVKPGTTLKNDRNIHTGFDHLKELGITHVQVMPIMNFNFEGGEKGLENGYNWGYNPMGYFEPQQQYNSCDYEAYEERLNEVKNMIDTFHKNGMRVILDTVYNHTTMVTIGGKTLPYFWPITKDYYLTQKEGNNFIPIDLTGCKNTINGSNQMVKNMVLDSLEYWIEKFNVDGFRFDLLGAFTYKDVQDISKEIREKYPKRQIMLYGEPWQGNKGELKGALRPGNISCTENIINRELVMGAGSFNPDFRETLRGKQDDGEGCGFIFNTLPNEDKKFGFLYKIEQGAKGAIRSMGSDNKIPEALPNEWDPQFANMPSESINYITCHDGLCYWDKILAWAKKNGNNNLGYLKRINEFGIGILMTSQGIPFFQSGDEILRTKHGEHNSYHSNVEINQIDWALKKINKDVFDYYKAMIEMRKAHPVLWMNTLKEIRERIKPYIRLDHHAVEFTIDAVGVTDESWKKVVIVYCSSNPKDYWVHLGEPTKGCEWVMVMDDGKPYDGKGKVLGEGDRWAKITSGTAVFMFVARPK